VQIFLRIQGKRLAIKTCGLSLTQDKNDETNKIGLCLIVIEQKYENRPQDTRPKSTEPVLFYLMYS